MSTPQPIIEFTVPNILSAINALYAPGAVQIQEIDKYLKLFQRDPAAWTICIQILNTNSLPPSVFL